ncbi:MAG: HD domain-containing protein [Deltaproteobacteria bacterium]|jgi:HD superfamily phosphodiesterase|nr:HD domain-containing protein [Deltaproteobacteria bacterium]
MKPVFEKIRQLAKPFLNTRHNDVHTAISTRLAFELLKCEGGDEDIVIPAILLHDTGWKRVPAELHLKAFGPNTTEPELNRRHEIESVKIAKEILQAIKHDPEKSKKILEIIDGHDSRPKALSLDDMIVKDADKLWRYSKAGFNIDVERFGESPEQGLERLRTHIFAQLFTLTAKEIASAKLVRRANEKAVECKTTR